jgi:hypothetical protein
VSTSHKMEIYEIINNMNYYIMLFININNLLNICDLKILLNHLNLLILKMLPNLLYSRICSCIVL